MQCQTTTCEANRKADTVRVRRALREAEAALFMQKLAIGMQVIKVAPAVVSIPARRHHSEFVG